MKSAKRFALYVIGPILAFFAFLLTLWLLSFIDLSSSDRCAIGSVNEDEYQELFKRAKALNWTVWPGLSKGVFWPYADGGEKQQEQQLLGHIKSLISETDTADRQLAAAHATMRAIGAEYVSRYEIRQRSAEEPSVDLSYFIPSRRFAPLCLFCLIWKDTKLYISFEKTEEKTAYSLASAVILYSGLKYQADRQKARNVPKGACPFFPRNDQTTQENAK